DALEVRDAALRIGVFQVEFGDPQAKRVEDFVVLLLCEARAQEVRDLRRGTGRELLRGTTPRGGVFRSEPDAGERTLQLAADRVVERDGTYRRGRGRSAEVGKGGGRRVEVATGHDEHRTRAVDLELALLQCGQDLLRRLAAEGFERRDGTHHVGGLLARQRGPDLRMRRRRRGGRAHRERSEHQTEQDARRREDASPWACRWFAWVGSVHGWLSRAARRGAMWGGPPRGGGGTRLASSTARRGRGVAHAPLAARTGRAWLSRSSRTATGMSNRRPCSCSPGRTRSTEPPGSRLRFSTRR